MPNCSFIDRLVTSLHTSEIVVTFNFNLIKLKISEEPGKDGQTIRRYHLITVWHKTGFRTPADWYMTPQDYDIMHSSIHPNTYAPFLQ